MNIGLIGSGMMGKVHAAVYKSMENIKIVSLLDSNAGKAENLCTEYNLKYYYDSDLFFKDESVDIVDICIPTFLHEEMIIRALESGKHVLCEKPLCLSVKSAGKIKEAIRISGKKFMVAQVMRFWPQYIKIKEILNDGTIGTIEKVNAYRLSEPPQWGNWFMDPDKGGGALYDLHIHDMDFIYSLFGKPDFLFAKGVKGNLGAWDSVVSLMEYKSKSVIIEGDYRYPKGFPFRFGLFIRGDKGAVEYTFEVNGNVDSADKSSEKFVLYIDDATEEIDSGNNKDAYFSEIEYFCTQIKEDKPIEQATIEEAIAVLDIINREAESMESGRKIDLREIVK